MSFRSRRHLEERVAHAINTNLRLEREKSDALARAQRADDIRGGILALHQPHAQIPTDGEVPPLFCTACVGGWPCETVEFVFHTGKFAPPPIES
jgi:hypothetical protein